MQLRLKIVANKESRNPNYEILYLQSSLFSNVKYKGTIPVSGI